MFGESDRYWVNWTDNSARADFLKDTVALVDEEKGGEIAFFTNEDHAHELAAKLNGYDRITKLLRNTLGEI
jgi:hypothetical protein